MSSTTYATQMATVAGVARPRPLGLGHGTTGICGSWTTSMFAAVANATKRPARHFGAPPV